MVLTRFTKLWQENTAMGSIVSHCCSFFRKVSFLSLWPRCLPACRTSRTAARQWRLAARRVRGPAQERPGLVPGCGNKAAQPARAPISPAAAPTMSQQAAAVSRAGPCARGKTRPRWSQTVSARPRPARLSTTALPTAAWAAVNHGERRLARRAGKLRCQTEKQPGGLAV